MIKKITDYLWGSRSRQQIAIAISKGAAMRQARVIDLARPASWEFSGFSQNGEDGILDVLRSQLTGGNRYFIEIGAADGMQNNSSWLAVAEQYEGLAVEGDARLVERASRLIPHYSIGVECLNMFVGRDNVQELKAHSLHCDPDVLSLDIDGVDYHVAQALLEAGFRPRIFVVEYNSVYGPERSMTIPYQDGFDFRKAHSTELYYGVSIAAWRKFFERNGYRFITVDRKGVNAFFVDPKWFPEGFLDAVRPLEFSENRYQYAKFRGANDKQFPLINDQSFMQV
jgi:hypothetical protein